MSMKKEVLEKRIDTYIEESKDKNFDVYLQCMKEELSKPEINIEEVERNIQINMELYRMNQEKLQKENKNDSVEFKVGAGILSVVGAVFIMIALITLGREFLSDFSQGMLLYIVALVFILFSELFLYDRQEKAATIFTSIGIGSVYLITWINYQYIRILPVSFAIAIAAATGIAAVLLSQKRDGSVIRIINIIGIYICMIPFQGSKDVWQFVVTACIIGIVNIMSMFIKAKSGRMAAEILQIVCIGLYTPVVGILALVNGLPDVIFEIYIFSYLIIMLGIFLKMEKKVPQLWIWAIFTLIIAIGVGNGINVPAIWVMLGIFVAAFGGACWQARNERCNWVLYYVISTVLIRAVQIKLPEGMQILAGMGMILGLGLVFQMVPQLQMKRKDVLSWILLGVLGWCSLWLPMGDYTAQFWIGMIIGIASVWILVRERFGISAKWRGIILAGYLSYMFFVCGIQQRLVISALLMLVALLAISFGFIFEEKVVRIYGLSLALVVCLKLVVWDFWGQPVLYRMLAFLVVGILSLVISLVYIILEKKR